MQLACRLTPGMSGRENWYELCSFLCKASINFDGPLHPIVRRPAATRCRSCLFHLASTLTPRPPASKGSELSEASSSNPGDRASGLRGQLTIGQSPQRARRSIGKCISEPWISCDDPKPATALLAGLHAGIRAANRSYLLLASVPSNGDDH